MPGNCREGPLTKTVAEDGCLLDFAELNATDADTASGSLTSADSAASNGATAQSGSGYSTLINLANANFNGSDSFEVQVSDGTLTDTITVNVTVSA